jgi:NAD(P)-dependent dehydrogenase (short-subunit alcohol dehydrogenase family)
MTESRSSQPVFVTGASTGIGRATAVQLAGLGHPVFASARKSHDLKELSAIDNVTAVRLDVRDPEQVAEVYEMIRSSGSGLYGLVNNAGVGGIGPVATFTDEEVRDLFEVNVFGVFRMTRTFLPLLLEARGRVVLVGSQGGSVSMKYFGPYTMTKHALEALAVALDGEIRPHGARVSIVQPGGVRTAIFGNTVEADRDRFLRAPSPFDIEARAILETFDDDAEFDPALPESASNRRPSSPEVVAEVIRECLHSPDPPLRSLVGTRWEGNRVLNTLMERIAQANFCPALDYSREELFARLDGFLAAEGKRLGGGG